MRISLEKSYRTRLELCYIYLYKVQHVYLCYILPRLQPKPSENHKTIGNFFSFYQNHLGKLLWKRVIFGGLPFLLQSSVWKLRHLLLDLVPPLSLTLPQINNIQSDKVVVWWFLSGSVMTSKEMDLSSVFHVNNQGKSMSNNNFHQIVFQSDFEVIEELVSFF